MNEATDPDKQVVRLERTFRAPVQKVFDAWLTPDLLRRWWPAGVDWETPVAEVDPREGGSLRLVMRSPDGEEFGGSGTYLEIKPLERLVYRWTWDGHPGHVGTQVIEVDFTDRGDGTTSVVLTNRGLSDDEAERLHREGWELSLTNLERLLGT